MESRHTIKKLIPLLVIAFTLINLIPSFADTTNYIYDDLNRLIRIERPDGRVIEFEYDATGNRLAASSNEPYTITATAGANGSISPSGTVVVPYKSSPTFSIIPDYGYHVVDVLVDGVSQGAVATYTFSNITANHTIQASFTSDSLTLSVSLSDPAGGTVVSSPAGINCGSECSKIYDFGTPVTLTATPNTGYELTAWYGACSGVGPCSLTIDMAKTVTANLSRISFIISATAGSNNSGTIAPAGDISVNYGASQTFAISPNIGYQIQDVLVDGVSAGPVTSYIFSDVTKNSTIAAIFGCSNLPVRIAGATPVYYATLQAAYNAAADNDTIQVQALKFSENLSINRNISVTVDGGYTCDYSTNMGNKTLLKGMLSTQSGGGTLTIKNFTLMSDAAAVNTVASPLGGTYNSAQTVTLTCGSNCDKIYYTTDGTLPTTSSNIYTAPITISQTTTLRYFATDLAGAREAVKSQVYIIDASASTGRIAINSGAVVTNTPNVSLNLACNDNVGCDQMKFSNDNINWSSPEAYASTKAWSLVSGDGMKTVYVKYGDEANNWSAVYNDSIILDTVPPVTTPSHLGRTYNSTISITFACNDAVGCDKIYYTTDGSTPTTSSAVYSSPINIAATTSLKFFAKDLAGNSETVRTETYTIDTVPPTGTISINGGASITNNTNVTLNLTCNDPLGCAQVQFSNDNVTYAASETFAATLPWILSSGDGTKTVYAKFWDRSGNCSTAYSASILLDATASVTTASPTGGTYSDAQSVTLTCNDGSGTGCDKIYYTTDGSIPTIASPVYSLPVTISATTTLRYFSKDIAGNSETVKSQTYTIGSTPPLEPIKIGGASPLYFLTLQDAYDAANTGDVIQVVAQSQPLVQNVNINRNISISIEGGYSNDFTSITGNTALKGMIRTFPNGGTLTIKNFILQTQ